MSKKYSIFLSVLFLLFLGGILAANLVTQEREFSPVENRYLQKFPKISPQTLLDGTFMTKFETYVNDQFAGRDAWVSLKSWSERLSGKHENNGVYFAGDNTLINRVDEPDQAVLDQDMEYVDALVEGVEAPVYFGLIPSAASIWSHRLPQGAPTADEAGIIADLYGKTRAHTVDLFSALSAHSGEEIYYRTDHHWTSLGAYYGYVALMQAMGLTPVELADDQRTTVTEEFYGTIYSTSGVRWVEPDRIDTYIPEEGVEVTSYFDGNPTQGSLYVDSYLREKDKYSYFLGGVQPLCVIRTERTDAPKVLLIRDSYSDSLAPFLTQNFSEIHLFDLRYNLMSVQNYIQEQDIDSVVVLYSISNFVSDQNLFLLGR